MLKQYRKTFLLSISEDYLNQVKFLEDSLQKILLGSFLNTLSHFYYDTNPKLSRSPAFERHWSFPPTKIASVFNATTWHYLNCITGEAFPYLTENILLTLALQILKGMSHLAGMEFNLLFIVTSTNWSCRNVWRC